MWPFQELGLTWTYTWCFQSSSTPSFAHDCNACPLLLVQLKLQGKMLLPLNSIGELIILLQANIGSFKSTRIESLPLMYWVAWSLDQCDLAISHGLKHSIQSVFWSVIDSIDVSGIIEKFNVYVTLAILPRTKDIHKAFWLVHIFIKTLSFLLLGRRISLLYDLY